METAGRRRSYDAAFKQEAVRLVQERGRSLAAVARDVGIHPSLLHRWQEAVTRGGPQAFPGQGQRPPDQAELRRLQRENAVLREERDILKKALAVFSQRPE